MVIAAGFRAEQSPAPTEGCRCRALFIRVWRWSVPFGGTHRSRPTEDFVAGCRLCGVTGCVVAPSSVTALGRATSCPRCGNRFSLPLVAKSGPLPCHSLAFSATGGASAVGPPRGRLGSTIFSPCCPYHLRWLVRWAVRLPVVQQLRAGCQLTGRHVARLPGRSVGGTPLLTISREARPPDEIGWGGRK